MNIPQQVEVTMTEEKIARINALYHKSKAEGLTEEEKASNEEFNKKIDVTDSTQVLQYGAKAQSKISFITWLILQSCLCFFNEFYINIFVNRLIFEKA